MRKIIIQALVVLMTTAGAFDVAEAMEESQLRQIARVAADTPLRYEDPDGKPIDHAQFVALLKGRRFGVIEENGGITFSYARSGDTSGITQRRAADFKLKPGDPLPEIELKDLDGQPVQLAQLRGKPLLLNFSFAECKPCIEEVPALNAFRERHPDWQLYSVTFDDAATSANFVTAHGLRWPMLPAAMPFIEALGISVYPSFVLVDAEGRLRKYANSAAIADGKDVDVEALTRWVQATD